MRIVWIGVFFMILLLTGCAANTQQPLLQVEEEQKVDNNTMENAEKPTQSKQQYIKKIYTVKQPSHCTTLVKGCKGENCLTYTPKILYLAGGNAKDLFEEYISQNSNIAKRIPYNFEIKFYEKDTNIIKLTTVKLDMFGSIGIDSRNSLFKIYKKKLEGKTAIIVNKKELMNTAINEKAELFYCDQSVKSKNTH